MKHEPTRYPGVYKVAGDSGRYLVRLYNPGGREYRKVVKGGLRDAVAHRNEVAERLARGGGVNQREQRRTFRHYADEWLDAAAVKHSSRDRYGQALRRDVFPVIGNVPVGKVRHSHARALLASLTRRRLSASTISLAMTVAHGVVKSAIRDGLLARDPFDGVRLPAVARRRVRHVPALVDVVRAAEARGQIAAALTVLIGTGLRASELGGLDVNDVDFLRRVATVRGQVLVDRQTQRPYYESTKSPDGMREIPLPQFVIDALAAWLVKRPAREVVLPVGGPDAEQTTTLRPVFTAERGDGPMTQDSLTARTLHRSAHIGVEAFGPHALRHRYTTVLHDAGVPQRTIDYVTGHAPVGVTLAVYVEVTPESLVKAREVIQTAWETAREHATEQPFTHFSRTMEAVATL